MNKSEVIDSIKDIPVGSKIQLVKKNGDIIDAVLASHETEGTELKDYGELKVPALPPAIIVQGKRWGTFRVEIDELVKIARVG